MTRNNSRGAVGAFHPILFFVVVYGIALFMALFICNAVYNSLHPAQDTAAAVLEGSEEVIVVQPGAGATAMR